MFQDPKNSFKRESNKTVRVRISEHRREKLFSDVRGVVFHLKTQNYSTSCPKLVKDKAGKIPIRIGDGAKAQEVPLLTEEILTSKGHQRRVGFHQGNCNL